MNLIKKECCEKSNVTIDLDSNTLTCGVKGIISGEEIRIINGNINCAKCGNTIYSEPKNLK